MRLYIGGPIDAGDCPSEWRDEFYLEIKKYYGNNSVVVYDPAMAFTVGGHLTEDDKKSISETNRTFINQADAALFYLPGRSRAFGTIREIEFASKIGIIVVLVDPDMVYREHVESHDIDSVDTVKDAITLLLGPNPTANMDEAAERKEDGKEWDGGRGQGNRWRNPREESEKDRIISTVAGYLRAKSFVSGNLYSGSLSVKTAWISKARNELRGVCVTSDGDGTVTLSMLFSEPKA